MIEFQNIHPLAIGTYGLGSNREEIRIEGESRFDDSNDMKSLIYQYEHGQNFIDSSYIYSGGQTMKFLGKFFKKIPRNTIYINTKIENYIEKVEDIEKQLDKYLSIMGIEFVDGYSIHAPTVSKLPIDEIYYYMERLIKKGKVRYLGTSNINIEQLKLLQKGFDIKTFEGLYNIECKINEDVGIIQYCKENNIHFIGYQPLRRNRTMFHNYPILINLSQKYNKTQNQIILNWIIKEKQISALVKTSETIRAKENLDALDFEIEKEDMSLLNVFRNKEFDNLEVDRDAKEGIPIRKLANQIE